MPNRCVLSQGQGPSWENWERGMEASPQMPPKILIPQDNSESSKPEEVPTLLGRASALLC